ASATKDTPASLIAGLKERELTFTNSMILHEQYFANLGGNGKAGGAIQQRLAAGYGTFARWEEHFRAVGQSLGGGSGWTIVDYSLLTGDVRTYWSGNHTQTLAASVPLLVMDMYEHARRAWRSAPAASRRSDAPATTARETSSPRTAPARRSDRRRAPACSG